MEKPPGKLQIFSAWQFWSGWLQRLGVFVIKRLCRFVHIPVVINLCHIFLIVYLHLYFSSMEQSLEHGIINVTQSQFIVKINTMAKSRIYEIILINLFFSFGCGDPGNGAFNLPQTDLIVIAEMRFPPMERVSGETITNFTGRLRIPGELEVLRGNSGVGWAGLTIGDRKFCYQGNAISEQTGGGDFYFLRNEAFNVLAPCLLRGEAMFETEAQVGAGDLVSLAIEEPGCSLEAGTCVSTQTRATLEILETMP